MPVYFDSACMTTLPDEDSAPPTQETYSVKEKMSSVCMNRHQGGINILFLDFSVRKVGIKELWTLQWNREFNTAGSWTRAGGVQPEAWPEWMQRFKDY